MIIIDCDLPEFIADNIPLGYDNEDDRYDAFEDQMEEIVIKGENDE